MPPTSTGWLAQLTAIAFNLLGQYAISPDYRAFYHAELAGIISTHCVYPRWDGQAELNG